jgi:hypothetical protein
MGAAGAHHAGIAAGRLDDFALALSLEALVPHRFAAGDVDTARFQPIQRFIRRIYAFENKHSWS